MDETQFRMVDVKKDGHMGESDFLLITDRFVKEYNLGPEKSKEIGDWLMKGWDMILHDKSATDTSELESKMPLVFEVNKKLLNGEKISEDEFTHAFIQLRQKDLALAERNLENMINVFFEIFDANSDGFITMAEMVVAMKCFGLEHAGLVQETFKCMDRDKDGKLSRKEYVGGWTDFFFGGQADNPLLKCFAEYMTPGNTP